MLAFRGELRHFRFAVLYITLALLCVHDRRCRAISYIDEVKNQVSRSVGNESEDPGANNESNDEESGEFSYLIHPDDHSIYAHRSLISAANVRSEESTEATSSEDDSENPLKTKDFVEKEWQLMFRAYDLAFDGGSSSVLAQIMAETNIFEEVVSKLKPQCRRDVYHIRNSVRKHKLWALRMADSNGKLPSGITYGKFSSPGDYEECLSVSVNEQVYRGSRESNQDSPETYKFNGKYCLIDFRLPMPERPHDKLLSIHDPVVDLSNTELGKRFPVLANYSGYASVLYEVGYMHAFCLPSTCDVFDLTNAMGLALEGLHIVVNNTFDCQERLDEKPPLRTSQVISLTLLIILILNAMLASAIHYLTPKPHQQQQQVDRKRENVKFQAKEANPHRVRSNRRFNIKRWLIDTAEEYKFYKNCFSIQSNFERLTKPDPRGLTFVHYTRIIAMALTVITHTAALGTLQAITKPADASNSEQIFRDFLPQMLANAFTSIQIFFFMAGFMLVISTYPSIKRDKGHISFVEYATKRAIRLMPGLAATISLNFLWPLIVDGPMLTYFIRMIVIPCETTWWRTMGFMSNFDHVEKMCLRHSYFSASDYQLHIMAFPLLLLLYKRPIIAVSLAGLITVMGFVAQVIMVLTKTLLPFMMVDYMDKEAFFNVVHYIHHPVWNHMSAFFYGFIMGYLVVKQIRVDWSEKTIRRIWITLLPLGIASIFAPYIWNHYKRPIYRWQMVIYVLIDRFILLTTCAWLSYATMVLSRPKRSPKKPETQSINLPEVVSLDYPKSGAAIELKQNDSANLRESNSFKKPGLVYTVNENNSNTLSVMTTSLPRQRSSPNIESLGRAESIEGGSNSLRPAQSSSDIGNLNTDIRDSTTQNAAASGATQQAQADQTSGTQQTGKPKRQAPISNVNILCLVLSRLTFQLYLFNMVVLWVDVNHSKYFWYFSYYFIITKAAAIYIVSSLCATVFFVLLESPCLTLYIVWVKSRADRRAKGQQAHQMHQRRTKGEDSDFPEKEMATNSHAFTPSESGCNVTVYPDDGITKINIIDKQSGYGTRIDTDRPRPKSADSGAPIGSVDLSQFRVCGQTKSAADRLDMIGTDEDGRRLSSDTTKM